MILPLDSRPGPGRACQHLRTPAHLTCSFHDAHCSLGMDDPCLRPSGWDTAVRISLVSVRGTTAWEGAGWSTWDPPPGDAGTGGERVGGRQAVVGNGCAGCAVRRRS